LEKRGQGRFSEEHVFSIMDSLVIESIIMNSGIEEFRDDSIRNPSIPKSQ
jgi:hypothetical protein